MLFGWPTDSHSQYTAVHIIWLDDKSSSLISGIPDAPLDVQVESGPQEGTLLVTWLPVTITTSGKSNGAIVTGYSIYVDGEKVQEMPSPTGKFTHK